MKDKRTTVILLVIVLFAASWYTMISNGIKAEQAYQECLAAAREYRNRGIESDAEFQYKKALKMLDTVELRCEIIEFYKDTGMLSLFEKAGANLISDYPKNPAGYQYLSQHYYEQEQYQDSLDILAAAGKRKVEAESFSLLKEKMRYLFSLERSSYQDVGVFSAGYWAVQNEQELWGYVNEKGAVTISCRYLTVMPFSSAALAAVQDSEGSWCVINEKGDKKYVDTSGRKLAAIGLISADKMAVTYDGAIRYENLSFEPLFDSYLQGTAFNNGVAFVRTEKGWKLIDENGDALNEGYLEAVIQDEKGIAFRVNRAFAMEDGEFYLWDIHGSRITTKGFTNARAFERDGIAAVEIQERWGFVDIDGQEIISPQYEEARSFAGGLAGVKVDGLWGFINLENKLVIENQFEEVKDFSDKGTVMVKKNGEWRLLSLYQYE